MGICDWDVNQEAKLMTKVCEGPKLAELGDGPRSVFKSAKGLKYTTKIVLLQEVCGITKSIFKLVNSTEVLRYIYKPVLL